MAALESEAQAEDSDRQSDSPDEREDEQAEIMHTEQDKMPT
jgi:hypothetical protein